MANYHRATTTTTTTGIDIIDHMLPFNTHNTYDVIFFGDTILTTVTSDPTVAASWISQTESLHHHHLIVGLDVEWRPSYSRIQNPVATLQLCVGQRCLIYQLIHSDYVPKSLVDFLANPNYTFVGVGVKEDVEKLKKDYHFGFNTNTVELGGLAAAKYGRMELNKTSLKELVKVVLRKEMEKPMEVTMSDWDTKRLSSNQVLYACIDAFVCFEIGRILNAPSAAAAASRSAPRGFVFEGLGTGSGSAGPSVDTSLTSDNSTSNAVVAGIAIFAAAAAAAGLYWLSSKEKPRKDDQD